MIWGIQAILNPPSHWRAQSLCVRRGISNSFVRRDPIVAAEHSARPGGQQGQVGLAGSGPPSASVRRLGDSAVVRPATSNERALTKRIESLLAKGRETQCLSMLDHGDIAKNPC